MKLTVNREELIDAIASAAKAISRNSPIPAMQCVLLEIKSEQLYVSGTNAELSVTSSLEVDSIDQAGSIVVPPALMLSILPNLQTEDVTLIIKGDKIDVGGVATVKGLPADDFPRLPEPKTKIMDLDTDLLGVIDSLVAPFTCRTDKDVLIHPTWAGIRIRRSGGALELMSIAGYEFSLWTQKSEGPDLDINVHAQVFDEAKCNKAELWLDEFGLKAILICNHKVISCSLLETSSFPLLSNYVRPYGPLVTAYKVGVAKLLPAVKIALALAPDTKCIRFEIKDEELVVLAESQNGKTEHSLSCEVRGKPLNAAIDGSYFLKILSQLSDKEIEVQSTQLEEDDGQGGKKPVTNNATLIRIIGEPNFVHGIVPMR